MVTAITVVSLALMSLAGCGLFSDEESKTIGPAGGRIEWNDATVTFAPGALASTQQITLRPVTAKQAPGVGGLLITDALDVDLGGATLAKPATVVLPLKKGWKPAPGTAVVAASSIEAGGGTAWSTAPGQLDLRRHVMTVQVTHFSKIAGVGFTARDLVARWSQVVSALGDVRDDLTYKAKVTCTPASGLWRVDLGQPDQVKSCAQSTGDGGAQVPLVNSHVYPQTVNLKGLPGRYTITADHFDGLTSAFFTSLGSINPGLSYLPGRGTLKLQLGPAAADQISFTSIPDPVSLIVEFVAKALMTVPLFRVEAQGGQKAIELFGRIWDFGECLANNFRLAGGIKIKNLTPGVVNGVVGECLNATRLVGNTATLTGSPVDVADVIVTALEDAGVLIKVFALVISLAKSAYQGEFGETGRFDQRVTIKRDSIKPVKDTAGAPIPAAVQRTVAALHKRALSYHANGDAQFNDLTGATGLLYSKAADPDQPPSLTLGEGPDPIAGPEAARALADLTETPPRVTVCPETQTGGYVFGVSDAKSAGYEDMLGRLGYTDEAAGIVAAHARSSFPYRVCIRADGTWTAFAKRAGQDFDLQEMARTPSTSQDGQGVCGPPVDSAFVPADALCPQSVKADLDGDGRVDRLILYTRASLKDDEKLVARAVLAIGAVTEVTVPTQRLSVDRPTVLAHLNLDGKPGEEVLVKVDEQLDARLARSGTILTLQNHNLSLVKDQTGFSYLSVGTDGFNTEWVRCLGPDVIQQERWSTDGTPQYVQRWRFKGAELQDAGSDLSMRGPRPSSDEAYGVDCEASAGGSAAVPGDGTFAALLADVDPAGRTITVHRENFVEYPNAEKACREDGVEHGDGAFCNDYYDAAIRPTLLHLPVGSRVQITTEPLDGTPPQTRTITLSELRAQVSQSLFQRGRITVKSGKVTRIKHIFTP